MSATTWLIIAIVGFSLAGVAFVAAVILFIRLNIPAVIGDLTGKTAAKEIQALRSAGIEKNSGRSGTATAGSRRFVGNTADSLARGEVHMSKRLDLTGGTAGGRQPQMQAEKAIDRVYRPDTARTGRTGGFVSPAYDAEGTDVLDGSADRTEMLSSVDGFDGTEVLADVSANRTEVLSSDGGSNETMVLTGMEASMPAMAFNFGETDVLYPEAGGMDVLDEGTSVLSTAGTEELPQTVPAAFTVVRSLTLIHTDEVIR